MANPNFPRGDTSPSLRLCIRDQAGLVDLASAERVTLYAKSGTDLITGPVDVLDPVEPDAADPDIEYNAEYEWQAGDTDAPGTFRGQVEVDFGDGIETYPNGQDGEPAYFTFHIVERVASAADLP